MGRVYPDETNTEKEYVNIKTQDAVTLEFAKARLLAKEKAREISGNPMMLAWKNGKTGEYYPAHECGKTEKPAWIVYAEARGANLTIDINDGDFIFLWLKM
jgi:hypothetical protein